MKRRVYDFKIFLYLVNGVLVKHLLFELGNVSVVNVSSDHFVETSLFGGLFGHCLDCRKIGHCLYFVHNAFIVRRCDLCSVLPVYLVSVVFRRIVARCNIDSGNTSKLSDCKRKLRSRPQALKYISLDSIRR